MHKDKCECESCRDRERLQNQNPDKEIGVQYALWAFSEGHTILISAEEINYLDEDGDQAFLKVNNDESSIYTIAYGVFKSQTNWHDNFYDLTLSKGATYFYLDTQLSELREAVIEDFVVISKNENQAKVCLMLKTIKELHFPKNNSELSITLTKLMPELGNQLKNLIFSRIEYGTFRLDQGRIIENDHNSNWQKFIDESLLFKLEYNRLLVLPKEEE